MISKLLEASFQALVLLYSALFHSIYALQEYELHRVLAAITDLNLKFAVESRNPVGGRGKSKQLVLHFCFPSKNVYH